MTREISEQEWQQLEDRISQFTNRLLNEDSTIENKTDSKPESEYEKDKAKN